MGFLSREESSMSEGTKGCQPAKNEQANKAGAEKRQEGENGRARIPYAIIWKDGKELELY